jgi:DNA-binding transcriptional LysR family regulator
VANLEEYLGVALLHSTTRRVTPTEVGLAYYDRCRAILDEIEDAEQTVIADHAEPRGILKVNAPMSFGMMHLGKTVVEFMAKYPDLAIQLDLTDRFVDPIQVGYDLVLRIAEPLPRGSLVVRPIIDVPRVLCAAPTYLNRKGEVNHPQDLKTHRCLHYGLLETGTRWYFQGPQGEESVKIDGIICANNAEVLRDAAVRGLGITKLPVFAVQEELRSGQLRRTMRPYRAKTLSLQALYPRHRSLSTKLRVFVEFLTQTFSKLLWDTIEAI